VLKRLAVAFVILAAAAVGSAGQRDTDGTIAYRFSFPEPAHRWRASSAGSNRRDASAWATGLCSSSVPTAPGRASW